jgi:hypothetical protein
VDEHDEARETDEVVCCLSWKKEETAFFLEKEREDEKGGEDRKKEVEEPANRYKDKDLVGLLADPYHDRNQEYDCEKGICDQRWTPPVVKQSIWRRTRNICKEDD